MSRRNIECEHYICDIINEVVKIFNQFIIECECRNIECEYSIYHIISGVVKI